jgi:hypothetical protein
MSRTIESTPASLRGRQHHKSILPGGQLSHLAPPYTRFYGNVALWVCLLITVIIRVWLVLRTHGIIDGDEALVGIQAEHILHGELPIYFYGQPYLGSLEAYFIALLFAIAGPSVWVLRAEPILLSLILVWLTWRLASALADAEQLPLYARRYFVIIATLLAAVPPLYDGVAELRTWGGLIETLILMLLLLLSAFQLTRRWQAGASKRELALRWAGIGFIVGLGFWIYPLIVSAVLAAASWIIYSCVTAIVRSRQQNPAELRQAIISTLMGLLPAVVAIPASLIGFAPALYWGATHQWQNITYIFGLEGGTLVHRLSTIFKVTRLYVACVAPDVISGAVPKENLVLSVLRSPLLIVGILGILTIATLVAFSFSSHNALLLCMRRLAALPLLFGACTALIFCISTASASGLTSTCHSDFAGRYATPLLLALPFFFATIFTGMVMYIREKGEQRVRAVTGNPKMRGERAFEESLAPQEHVASGEILTSGEILAPARGATTLAPGNLVPQKKPASGESLAPTNGAIVESLAPTNGAIVEILAPARGATTYTTALWLRSPSMLQGILFAFLLVYLGMQAWTYGLTDEAATFQSPFCREAPANNDPIIAYMQREHISYAWAPNLLGYPIVFKTNSRIIIANPLALTNPPQAINRIPAYTAVVQQADRPSFLVFARHDDTHPALLRMLDDEHVMYRVARFPSEPGFDVLVVTPVSRTVSPLESKAFYGFFICSE